MDKEAKLTSLVSGGSGGHSHNMIMEAKLLRLIPSMSDAKVKFFFLGVSFFGLGASIFSFYQMQWFDGVLLFLAAFMFNVFRIKGQGIGEIRLELDTKRLMKVGVSDNFSAGFDEVVKIEIIKKKRSAANGYVVETSELNIELSDGVRRNLATGGDMDIIHEQAQALKKVLSCEIVVDDNDWS